MRSSNALSQPTLSCCRIGHSLYNVAYTPYCSLQEVSASVPMCVLTARGTAVVVVPAVPSWRTLVQRLPVSMVAGHQGSHQVGVPQLRRIQMNTASQPQARDGQRSSTCSGFHRRCARLLKRLSSDLPPACGGAQALRRSRLRDCPQRVISWQGERAAEGARG